MLTIVIEPAEVKPLDESIDRYFRPIDFPHMPLISYRVAASVRAVSHRPRGIAGSLLGATRVEPMQSRDLRCKRRGELVDLMISPICLHLSPLTVLAG